MKKVIKMLFCNHHFEATDWNNGDYSGAFYETECTCNKCGRRISRTYKDKNTPRVDGGRFLLVCFIIIVVIFFLIKFNL